MRAALTGWLLGMLVLACAGPVPPTSGPPAVSPTLPATSAPPTLHVGGIAAAAGFIHLQIAAGDAPAPGAPDAGNFEAGTLGYLLAGPERVTGVEWWQVQSEGSLDVGWAASSEAGTQMLVPLDPACPPVETVTVDQVIGIGRVRGLVCFGFARLTFDANVFCASAALDGGPGGATWMNSNRTCGTVGNPGMGLLGHAMTDVLGADLAANAVSGRFRITGHYDDPESSGCWMVPVGVNLDAKGEPDPRAVIACRERFVVDKAVRLD